MHIRFSDGVEGTAVDDSIPVATREKGADRGLYPRRVPTRRMKRLFRSVAVASVLAGIAQVALGGVVRVTGSGLGCPDWPLCHGQIIPPFDTATLIEYSHRLSASMLMVLVLATTWLAWTYYRSDLRIVASALLGLGLVLVAAVLGGVTVLTELVWWVVLLHLGIAECAVACMVIVAFLGWRPSTEGERQAGKNPSARRLNALVIASLAAAFVLVLSGSYMVGYGAGSSCGTWPLCRGSLLPGGTAYAIHMGHRFLTVLAGGLILVTAAAAWTRRALQPDLGWTSVTLCLLFGAQVLAGAFVVWTGFTAELKAAHLTLATLVWASLVLLSAAVYAPQRIDAPALSSTPGGAPIVKGAAR